MSEELQKPPVVDVDAILQPIAEDNPSGDSLRYSGIYDEIAQARRSDDDLNLGEWQTEIKVADFRKVIDIAVPALTSQSKDLQVAAWLTEALVKQFGFVGLRDGLRIMAGLQENFWETLHPEIDEGDMEGRANAISWMDREAAFAFKQVPVTTSGPSYFGWEDAKRFDIPENLDSLDGDEQQKWLDLKAQAERERRVTGEQWRKAKARTRRQFYEEAAVDIAECAEAFTDLNRVIEENFDRNQVPGMPGLKKAIDDVRTLIDRLLAEKRIEEPDEDAEESYAAEDSGDYDAYATNGNGAGSLGSTGGSVQNRREALKRLAEIAAFFQKTEPHSPVAYLVQRAVKWGNMPLESWLQDVIKDEGVLHSLRETLGLGAGEQPANDAYSESYYEEEPGEVEQEETADDNW